MQVFPSTGATKGERGEGGISKVVPCIRRTKKKERKNKKEEQRRQVASEMPGNTVDSGRYGRASPETQNRTLPLFSFSFGGGST